MISFPVWAHVLYRRGYDVTSCLVPCSFQGVLSQRRHGPRGGGMVPEGCYCIPYPLLLTSSGRRQSGWYASYWNAFFLSLIQAEDAESKLMSTG